MVLPSRIPVVIDALFAKWKSTLTVPVYDGPQPVAGDDLQFLVVGHDGSDGEALAARANASWASLSPSATRDELVDIDCVAVARSGDAGVCSAMRLQVCALEAAAEAALRADLNLGYTPGVQWVEITTAELYQSGAEGSLARLAFTVHARCRI